MNNKQKLHQLKITQWAARFQEQAASGLTIKVGCAENTVTIHTYNYLKHKLKLEHITSLLPAEHDIVHSHRSFCKHLPFRKHDLTAHLCFARCTILELLLTVLPKHMDDDNLKFHFALSIFLIKHYFS